MSSEHLAIFEKGKHAWNEWRQANPSIKPALTDADLSERDLSGYNLSEADLSGSELCQTDLSGTNLKLASLRGADLSGANLADSDLYKCDFTDAFLTEAMLAGAYAGAAKFCGADLRGVSFERAILTEADFQSANLMGAGFQHADLSRCNLTRADLRNANFEAAQLMEMEYGKSRDMRGKYFGIRGLESSSGNALFVRDAQDQDYLDTMEHRISGMPQGPAKRAKRAFFRAWGLIDYGRSLTAPVFYAAGIVLMFGLIFSLDMMLQWGLFSFEGTASNWLTPIYFSVVTFTTLGYGDVTPLRTLGEVLVIIEVILGYTTLGLVLSILANKVARRS